MSMTMKEFSEVTGVPLSTVRYYCDTSKTGGNLFPFKGDNPKHGNHRRFGDEELDRMEQILIYQKLGLRIQEIRDKLNNPNYDHNEGLNEAIQALRKRIKHLQYVEFLANSALAMGTSFYSWGALDDDAIDAIGESIERDPAFARIFAKLHDLTLEESVQKTEELLSLAPAFLACLDEGEEEVQNYAESRAVFLARANDAIDSYFAVASDFMPPRGIAVLYSTYRMFVGDGILQALFDKQCGPGTADKIASVFFFIWFLDAAKTFDPLVVRLYEQKNDPASLRILKAAIVEELALVSSDDSVREYDEDPDSFIYVAEDPFDSLGDPDASEFRAILGIDSDMSIITRAYKNAIETLEAEARSRKGDSQ